MTAGIKKQRHLIRETGKTGSARGKGKQAGKANWHRWFKSTTDLQSWVKKKSPSYMQKKKKKKVKSPLGRQKL